MQIWRSEEKSDDKIIAYFNNSIYRVNPKPNEMEEVVHNFTMNITPTKQFTEIRLYEIKRIELEEGKKYIVVYYGPGSYEHLRIKDDTTRQAVFNYFKDNLPKTTYQTYKPTKSSVGKKPLIAMCVVAALFAWTLYISIRMEAGNEYEASGGQYHSIAGIVLLFASMGTVNVILVFGALLAISIIAYVRKIRNIKTFERISVTR